jgi:hypothetical protein
MPFDTAGRTNDVKASSSDVRIALARRACEESVSALNQILADTMTHQEQEELVDTIAERIQTLGGTSIAIARRAADLGDDGTNDLLVSDVVRTNEKQAWFVREHLRGDGK